MLHSYSYTYSYYPNSFRYRYVGHLIYYGMLPAIKPLTPTILLKTETFDVDVTVLGTNVPHVTLCVKLLLVVGRGSTGKSPKEINALGTNVMSGASQKPHSRASTCYSELFQTPPEQRTGRVRPSGKCFGSRIQTQGDGSKRFKYIFFCPVNVTGRHLQCARIPSVGCWFHANWFLFLSQLGETSRRQWWRFFCLFHLHFHSDISIFQDQCQIFRR